MENQAVSILIVDDEEPIRKLLASYLSSSYACVTAGSAEEAKEQLAAASFNLVLTDLTMPGASGVELCEHVNATYENTVVIIISGQADDQSLKDQKRCAAFDFIAKPFDLAKVLNTVKRALAYQAGRAAG
jgi:DNA-binding NtrC family response regulator